MVQHRFQVAALGLRAHISERGADGGRGGGDSPCLARIAVQHFRRQVLPAHFRSRGEDGDALDDIAQLPDVARPAVGLERGQSVRRQGAVRQAGMVELPQEVACEHRHIPLPFAERRKFEYEDGEPVVEVLTKGTFGHLLLQIPVGCGDDTHIHLFRLCGAHRFKFPFLQHAQHLGLGFKTHVGDLVQEECTAISLLEGAHLVPQRPGEGALDVAEEDALNQLTGDGRAVDLDKGFSGASGSIVDGPGHQLLAGARFAHDEHTSISGCHTLNPVAHLVHLGGFAHHLAPRRQPGHLTPQPPHLQGIS